MAARRQPLDSFASKRRPLARERDWRGDCHRKPKREPLREFPPCGYGYKSPGMVYFVVQAVMFGVGVMLVLGAPLSIGVEK